MRVLLDTQALLHAYAGDAPLSRRVLRLLEDVKTERMISTVSIMEIAVKNGIGKLKMGEVEMREAIRDLRVTILPFETRHAYRMFALPLHHRDPFDRMIIATALSENLPLVGADREFKKYKGLKVIW